MNEFNKQKITTPENTEMDALKASYWTAVAASAHNTFSEPSTFQLSLNETQKPVTSKSRFDNTQTSQWLMASKPKAFESVNQDLSRQTAPPMPSSNGEPQTHLPDIYRVTLKGTAREKDLSQAKKENDTFSSFFEQFDSAKNTKSAAKWKADNLQSRRNELDCDDQLNILSSDFSDNELSLVKDHWTSKLLNNPKMVAAVIGLCLLASSVYAGLGYWWLTSANVSQAAEPESGQAVSQSSNSDLFNIKALQKQMPTGQSKNKINPNERLIAQAEPVATFAMADSVESVPELSGRPDPFSPLIQEANGTFIAPTENQDALTGVQYTGFIGGVNSKNKIAIIKVADANPAVPPKTLFKKAGESFYINGERIYLSAIGKTSLSLQLKNENRELALNPYKVIVNNTASAAGSSGGNGSTAGSSAVSGAALSSNFGNGSPASFVVSSSTGELPASAQSMGVPANNASMSSNSTSKSGNGININLEE